MWFIRSLMLVALVAAIGCGGGPAPETVTPPSQMDNVKTMLQGIADSGTVGSGVMDLQAAIETMKSTDPDKASTLDKSVTELMALSDAAAIKTKAKEIIDSL